MTQVTGRIHDFTLMEARRSLLTQVLEVRQLEDQIVEMGKERGFGFLSDGEVQKLTDDLLVKHDNLMMTADHIDSLRTSAR